MNWLLIKNVKTLFQSNEVNIFKLTGSKVVGRKFSGRMVVTFLMDQYGGNFVPLFWQHITFKYFVQLSNIKNIAWNK